MEQRERELREREYLIFELFADYENIFLDRPPTAYTRFTLSSQSIIILF